MIKALAGDVLILVLSDRNLELLREGKPAKIKMSDLTSEPSAIKTLYIAHARTEEEGMKSLESMITPETRIPGRRIR